MVLNSQLATTTHYTRSPTPANLSIETTVFFLSVLFSFARPYESIPEIDAIGGAQTMTMADEVLRSYFGI